MNINKESTVFYETMPQYLAMQFVTTHLRARLYAARTDEQGMTTETVIITALLAVAALTVGGIILAAVTSKGNSVSSTITTPSPTVP